MGLLNLMYRRPKHVDGKELEFRGASLACSEPSGRSKTTWNSSNPNVPATGIPEGLAFDRIIEDGTCPPCTKRDFMNYLTYIEHSAENLQFFLWYRDYAIRFQNAPKSDVDLSPLWTRAMEEEASARMQHEELKKRRPDTGGKEGMFAGTDFDKSPPKTPASASVSVFENPFMTPPRTADKDTWSLPSTVPASATGTATTDMSTYRSQAGVAYAAAGVKTPFTIQPFRQEIDRIIAIYIMEGAPRQLNLSAREQKITIQALASTTHPSAFRMAVDATETSLRFQAHPNFIRWSICNGNPPRVVFARGLGASLVILGFILAVVLTLSRAGCGWRALAAIAWVLGISTLVAAYKGMCVVLHGMHHRHVRPWELFIDDEGVAKQEHGRFDAFGSSRNSYEDEPWVAKYQKRNIMRKIFDREVWIKEPALRQIQDTIFVQSILLALLLSCVLTGVFMAVPAGNLF